MTNPEGRHTARHHAASSFGKWKAALLVASVIAILHHQSSWLDQMDGITFGAVSTLRFAPAPRQRPDVVWLYGINEDHFKDAYKRQSPLNRCVLAHDLSQVFEAMHGYNLALLSTPTQAGPNEQQPSVEPGKQIGLIARATLRRLDVVVVDLDLSPDPVPPNSDQQDCQADLDRLVRGEPPRPGAKTAGLVGPRPGIALGPFPLRVVLMEPFDADTNPATQKWMQEMLAAGVRFGTPWIRSNFGMVTRYACDPASLAAIATVETGGNNDCIEQTAADFRRYCDEKVDCHAFAVRRMRWIDPDRFRDVDEQRDPRTEQENGTATAHGGSNGMRHIVFGEGGQGAPPLRPVADRDVRAVFVGVLFGEDLHITPVNQLSGVEVHAATFLSMLAPTSNAMSAAAIAIDLIIGWAFAFGIHACWEGHAESRRLADGRWQGSWILLLACGYVLALGVASFLSVLALRYFGIWLSPLPMAIGMLIESAVSGQLETFHEYLERSRRAKRRSTTGAGAGTRSPAIWPRFSALRDEGRWIAASWTLAAPLVWLAIVGYAVWPH